MATLKHINSKNADYGAAEQYLLFEHDEFTMKPVLDETGRLIPREDYRLSTLNCDGEDFAVACMRANLRYQKNQRREDVKSHHYEYAMKYKICMKDYSGYVDIIKFKDKNPNKTDRSPFSKEEIDALWLQENNLYAQIVLMLIYSGVRVSELLDLKRENVNIDEHCFKVVESKTESGIRVVPIHDRTYPFFKKWYEDDNEYLLHTPDGKQFIYRNYYDSYWTPVMELIGCSHKPHDTRHTCISMMTEKEVSPTLIKKIVGHSGAMSLTEKVYTHVNVQELLEAINKI